MLFDDRARCFERFFLPVMSARQEHEAEIGDDGGDDGSKKQAKG
jgi:hypothetical protein